MKKIIVCVLLGSLFFWGCNQSEKENEISKPAEFLAPVVEKKEPAKDFADKFTATVREKSGKLSVQLEETLGEAAEKADDMVVIVQEKSEEVLEKAAEMADTARERSKEFAAKANETGTSVSVEISKNVDNAKQSAQKVVAVVTAPVEVVLENMKGTVTLPHKMHSDSFDCTVCHGEETPGPLKLGKKEAHKLCKTCHQEKEAGPTKCTGCHVKKN